MRSDVVILLKDIIWNKGCTLCVDACTIRRFCSYFYICYLPCLLPYLCIWYRISVGSFTCRMSVIWLSYACRVESPSGSFVEIDGLTFIELNWIEYYFRVDRPTSSLLSILYCNSSDGNVRYRFVRPVHKNRVSSNWGFGWVYLVESIDLLFVGPFFDIDI